MHFNPYMMFWTGINFLILLLPFVLTIGILYTLSRMRKELQEMRETLQGIAQRLDKGNQQ